MLKKFVSVLSLIIVAAMLCVMFASCSCSPATETETETKKETTVESESESKSETESESKAESESESKAESESESESESATESTESESESETESKAESESESESESATESESESESESETETETETEPTGLETSESGEGETETWGDDPETAPSQVVEDITYYETVDTSKFAETAILSMNAGDMETSADINDANYVKDVVCLKGGSVSTTFTAPADGVYSFIVKYIARSGSSKRAMDIKIDNCDSVYMDLEFCTDSSTAKYAVVTAQLTAGEHTVTFLCPTGFDDSAIKACDFYYLDIYQGEYVVNSGVLPPMDIIDG